MNIMSYWSELITGNVAWYRRNACAALNAILEEPGERG